jgi:hypothetical protein
MNDPVTPVTRAQAAVRLAHNATQLLMGDTLKPQEGDTQEALALKTKGRAYRDRAMKMLERLSGIDGGSQQAARRVACTAVPTERAFGVRTRTPARQ